MSELTNNSTHERDVGKLTKAKRDINKKEVELLKQTRDILAKQQMSLIDISNRDDGAVADTFKKLRESTLTSIASIKEKIAKFEAKDSELTDIRPA